MLNFCSSTTGFSSSKLISLTASRMDWMTENSGDLMENYGYIVYWRYYYTKLTVEAINNAVRLPLLPQLFSHKILEISARTTRSCGSYEIPTPSTPECSWPIPSKMETLDSSRTCTYRRSSPILPIPLNKHDCTGGDIHSHQVGMKDG